MIAGLLSGQGPEAVHWGDAHQIVTANALTVLQ
jgi:hypothetical protein